jgi:toxin ParE1/3/4
LPRLVFSPRAEVDLEEIGDYIARDNPARAISFLDEVRARCDRIAATPASYPAREDLARAYEWVFMAGI